MVQRRPSYMVNQNQRNQRNHLHTRPVPQSETFFTTQRSQRSRRNLGALHHFEKEVMLRIFLLKMFAVGVEVLTIEMFKLGRSDVREISWNTLYHTFSKNLTTFFHQNHRMIQKYCDLICSANVHA